MKNIIKELEMRFTRNSNPIYAAKMKKYMRDKFEYLGISSPLRKELTKDLLNRSNLPPLLEVREISTELWNKPEREYQYFAQEFLNKYSKQYDAQFIDHFEHLITTKSWWDTVDHISSNLVGSHLQRFPALMIPTSRKWCLSDNMWLQRASIIFQLKYKFKTNENVLFEYIKHHSDSSEFFIRKAIGWALREYSKTHPQEVIEFVNTNQLSGLSKREALKKIK